MGHHHKIWWQVTWLMMIIASLLLSSSSSSVQGSSNIGYDPGSLDDLFCKQSSRDPRGDAKTGVFYNVSLPSNFTGMEISVVRLRTASFWLRGLNHSYINFPPRIVPRPNMKRIAILYENFGNWSSHYYNVPTNYTMVAPVFGFAAYSSSEKSLIDCEKMNLIIQGESIKIKFTPNVISLGEKNVTPICAKFGDDGSLQFSNMTKPYLCESKSLGHYTLVIPTPKEALHPKKRKRFSIWWVLGFVIGLIVLVILVLILIAIVKGIKKRRLKKMEKVSEGGEPFDTFWIGGTKLPLATMLRTQPAIEHDDTVRC